MNTCTDYGWLRVNPGSSENTGISLSTRFDFFLVLYTRPCQAPKTIPRNRTLVSPNSC